MAVTYSAAAQAASTSVSIPAHVSGDVIIICAYRVDIDNTAALTPPSVPSASGTVPTWTTLTANTGNSVFDSGVGGTFYNSMRVAYTVATANNHTSGTWTNTTSILAVVVKGNGTFAIGGYAESGGGSPPSAPAIILSNATGSSLLLHAYSTQNATPTWSSAPTGYTRRYTAGRFALNSKNSSTTDGAIDQAATSSVAVHRAATVEILDKPNASQFFAVLT